MAKIFNLRKVPLLLLAVLLGIIASAFLSRVYYIVVYCVVTIIILLALFWDKWKLNRLMIIIFAVMFLIANIITSSFSYVQNQNIYDGQEVKITGRVTLDTPFNIDGSINTEKQFINITLDSVNINGKEHTGKLSIKCTKDIASTVIIGDYVSFNGIVSRININPTDTFGINKFCDGYRFNAVPTNQDNNNFIFQTTGNKLKVVEKIKIKLLYTLQSATDDQTASFLYAMTVGDSQNMNADDKEAFSKNGTAHLFAVSGLHIGILAGFIILMLSKTRVNEWIKILIIATILIFYCALCGFSSSTIRATIMLLTYLVSKALGARNDILSTISLSAIIILFIQPYNLFDIGFLLSYFAVLGIVMLSPAMNKMFSRFMPKKLASAISVSICANIGILPFTMLFFGKMSLIFVFANLICIPIVAIMFPIYIITATISLIIPITYILISGVGVPFWLIIKINEWLAKINFLTINLSISPMLILLYICMLVFLSPYCLLQDKPKKIVSIVVSVVILGNSLLSIKGITASNNVLITAQGQGNYMFIKSYDYGNYLVCENLNEKDIKDIKTKAEQSYISNLQGVIFVDNKNGYDLLQKLYAVLPFQSVYSRNYVFNCDFAYTYNSQIIDQNFVVAYLEHNITSIVINELSIVWVQKGVTSYDYIDCNILVGKNLNNQSVVKNLTIVDNNYNNYKNTAVWGCRVSAKNGKILKRT